MEKEFDAFLSYASEDLQYANELVGALKAKGLNIWYAPLQLNPGDNLIRSIEEGMRISKCAILLLSKDYLSKNWTGFELDTLINQYIEDGKRVIPIWKNINREDLSKSRLGLVNIFALNANDPLSKISDQIVATIVKEAKTVLVTPSYEDPAFCFLTQNGEMLLNHLDGRATTLWEFLIYAKDNDYPVFMEGQVYSKTDFLWSAAQVMPHIKDQILHFISQEQFDTIWKMCEQAGCSPSLFQ